MKDRWHIDFKGAKNDQKAAAAGLDPNHFFEDSIWPGIEIYESLLDLI